MLAGCLSLASSLCAQGAPCSVPPESAGARPATALVLSGGGARGFAHLGVLRVLEELHVPVDCVVGTSMGSFLGGLYASGYSVSEMEAELLAVDWRDVFTERPPRQNVPFRRKQDDGLPLIDFEMAIADGLQFQAGLISGQKLGVLLQSLTFHAATVERFDELPLPFRAVATDLQTGEPVAIGHGNLGTAMRASMAVPSILAPVEVEGRSLVDGGMVMNLPVNLALEMGAERILAVDVSSPLGDLSKYSVFGVAAQSLSIYGQGNVRLQIELLVDQDVLIVPGLDGITAGSFDLQDLRRAIASGENAARSASQRLAEFSVSERDYQRFLVRQRRDVDRLVVDRTVDRVRIVGNERVSTRQIRARLETRAGEPLELPRLRRDLSRVYEVGEFQQVAFRLVDESDDSATLEIRVEEKPWGPNYLRFGLALESNLRGRGHFSALAQLTKSQLNALGGEWKTRISVGSVDGLFTELYQPLGPRGIGFAALAVDYFDTETSALSAEGELGLIELEVAKVSLDVGIQFSHFGEFRLGALVGRGDVDVLTDTGSFGFELGGWRTALALDRLDNANFPKQGGALFVEAFFSREALGADIDYDKLDLFAIRAASFGQERKNSLVGWFDGTTNFDTDAPFFDGSELGGLLSLSGLDPGSLRDDTGGVLSTLFFRQIAPLPQAFGSALYLGGSVEAGGVWPSLSDVDVSDLSWAGSLLVGADTKLGPLYLAYGRAEGGQDAFYFFLGRLFSGR